VWFDDQKTIKENFLVCMGLQTSKLEPDSLEFEWLRGLDWPEEHWLSLFDGSKGSSAHLNPEQASRFFDELFKQRNRRQFVASAMLRLDVARKGQLDWKDIQLLRQQCLMARSGIACFLLLSFHSLGAKSSPAPDPATRIVKLAALREGIATTLDYLQTNDRVSVSCTRTSERTPR